jgi:hypothetical protein
MPTWPAKTNYATGDVLTAAQMQDIGNALNSLESAQYAAGKNKLINGDFYINQRGFTSTTTAGTYGFDRWTLAGAIDGTTTMSTQTFIAGTAPVTGYEAVNFLRVQTTGQTLATAASTFSQRIEDVRTVTPSNIWTVSFWAKAASGTPKVAVELAQNFGSGGSSQVNNYLGQVTLSTSWARYSVTITMPSISGKTIGSGSLVNTTFWLSAGSNFDSRTGTLGIQTNTFDFWGVQVEQGSVATAFQTATGTLAGELALAMRYYQKSNDLSLAPGDTTANGIRTGFFGAAVAASRALQTTLPVRMRTAPTVTYYSNTTGSSGNVRNVSTGADMAVSSQGAIGETSIGFPTLASAPLATDAYSFHYVASAEL